MSEHLGPFSFQHIVPKSHRMTQEAEMRTTVTLEEKLLEEAQELTGITDRSRLIHEGLEALIQSEAARRLANLGGSAPDIQPMSRRRPASDDPHRHLGLD